MKYTFIVNPRAGKGHGRRVLESLRPEIHRRDLDAEVLLTERSGHATQLAASCLSPYVVAVGGDGTINEVVNGIMGSHKTLGILSCGSGNDLIKSLGIPSDFMSALGTILLEQIRKIDCGTVSCTGADGSTTRYFVNGVGIGFDAAVAEHTTKAKYLSGTALYVFSVFCTLGKYTSPLFNIHLDATLRRSRNLLIAIGNGCSAGGGFYLTPEAKIDDGYLDVCMIDELSIPKILAIMPKVMKGRHTGEQAVSMARVRRIAVEAEESFFVHADGEMVGRNVNTVEVAIVADGLSVIVN